MLAQYEYDPYDRLIQLCDALATGARFCMIEQRLVDVALRRGMKECTLDEWRVLFEVKAWFEQRLGQSIYACLPVKPRHHRARFPQCTNFRDVMRLSAHDGRTPDDFPGVIDPIFLNSSGRLSMESSLVNNRGLLHSAALRSQ